MRAALGTLAALALVLGGIFGAGPLLVVADPLPARADAIVVLAGSIPDRVLEAADLYRSGVAPRVVVTRERVRPGEPVLRARGVHLPESDELTIQALQGLGVPAHAVVRLRRRTNSTESEARTIARWACTHRVRTVVAVTSRFHTRRARLILRATLGPTIALTVRPSRYDPFDAPHWWRDRRDSKNLLSEYQKLTNYWLHEHWTLKPCGGLRLRRPGAGDA